MADPVRDFEGTEDGEWAVTDGRFTVLAGAAAVPQGIRVMVRLIIGEVHLDPSAGTIDMDLFYEKGTDPLVVRELIRQGILRVPDVTDAVGTMPDLDADRVAEIEYEADTVYSEVPLSATVEVP
jgi:hypothetical protein